MFLFYTKLVRFKSFIFLLQLMLVILISLLHCHILHPSSLDQYSLFTQHHLKFTSLFLSNYFVFVSNLLFLDLTLNAPCTFIQLVTKAMV